MRVVIAKIYFVWAYFEPVLASRVAGLRRSCDGSTLPMQDFVSPQQAFLPAMEDPCKLIIQTRYRYENISETRNL